MENWMKGKGKLPWKESKKSMNSPYYGMPSKLFADNDKDGVPNVFDCKPRNRKRQDVIAPMAGGSPVQEMYARQEYARQAMIQQRLAEEAQKKAAEEAQKKAAEEYAKQQEAWLKSLQQQPTYEYGSGGTPSKGVTTVTNSTGQSVSVDTSGWKQYGFDSPLQMAKAVAESTSSYYMGLGEQYGTKGTTAAQKAIQATQAARLMQAMDQPASIRGINVSRTPLAVQQGNVASRILGTVGNVVSKVIKGGKNK